MRETFILQSNYSLSLVWACQGEYGVNFYTKVLSINKWYITKNAFLLHLINCIVRKPGGRLNKKDGLTRYGDSHVKDKTS